MDRRNTIQRQLVLEAVQTLCHPSAEQVYEAAKQSNPHVSKATVYRNLNLLAEQEIIRKVEAEDSSSRYDHRTDAHYHMHCRICGKLTDAAMRPLETPERYLEQTDGFTVERHELLFVGICADCKNKIKGGNSNG